MEEGSFKQIQDFLFRYRSFTQEAAGATIQLDIDRYKSLFQRFAGARVEAMKADRKTSSHYNIFSILKLQKKEVITHTPILTNLLDPSGSHAQGDLFYQTFLKQVLKSEKTIFANIHPAYLRVKNEWSGGIYGRMDVFVQHYSAANPFAWVIENKIGADDQEDQLQDYYYYLTRALRMPEQNIRLFYLTPDGRDASPKSIDEKMRESLKRSGTLVNISYEQDITSWLEGLMSEIESDNVLHTIKQYIKTIKDYCL